MMLRDKVTLWCLTNLQAEEEVEKTHVCHLKCFGEGSLRDGNVVSVTIGKDEVIRIYDVVEEAILMVDVEVGIYSHKNPYCVKKASIRWFQARGACLKP